MQNRKSRIKNKIAISIVITMLIASVFSIFSYAANTSTTKLATIIYKINNNNIYYVEANSYIPIEYNVGNTTNQGTLYYMNHLNSSNNLVNLVLYQTNENNYMLLCSNSTSSTYNNITIDETLGLKAIYRLKDGIFRYGFNDLNININPENYNGIAKVFAYAYANKIGNTSTNVQYATDMFATANSNTQIVNNSVVYGQVGDVYQGLISNDGYIYSTMSKYKYTLVQDSMQVTFGLQSNISGINYSDRGLILQYMLDKEEIQIPADGENESYNYPFGTITIYNNTTSSNSIAFFMYFNGTIYADTSSPLYAFVTAITLQAFDILEFNDTQFIWATYANINQNIELDIINNQLQIIEILENGETSAYQEFIDNFESAVSDENLPPIDISAENSYFESVWAAHEDDLTYYKSWFLTPLWNEWVIIEVITAALFLGFISYIIFGKKA